MKRYAVKLTINGLYGAFAEKYSRTIKDAQYLHRLLVEKGPKATRDLLEHREDPAYFDPLQLFPAAMKMLRRSAHDHARRRFFTGVRFEPTGKDPSPWAIAIEDEDDAGKFVVTAFGTRAYITRTTGEGEPLEEDISASEDGCYVVSNGTYRCQFETWETLFRGQLDGLVTMCEEAMAKNQDLIVTCVVDEPGDPDV